MEMEKAKSKTPMPKMSHENAEWDRRVLRAWERIQSHVVETPIESAPELAPEGLKVFFKMENRQRTGSFKLRGAANKLLSLTEHERGRGVIAASNGNHGLAVADAAQTLGVAAEVYVSSHVSPAKAARIESQGARIRRVGTNPLDAELAARAAALQSGKVFISPYNDPEVVAGQGTIAVELLRQIPGLDTVYVAVGGGGLVGGIGAYLKWASPRTEVVGCWPENSRVLYESIRAGEIIDYPEQPTLSESTAGGLESGSITLNVCRDAIDRSMLVSEQEILEALRQARKLKGWEIEGAAAVALAALRREASFEKNKTVAVIVCGGNVSPEVLRQIG